MDGSYHGAGHVIWLPRNNQGAFTVHGSDEFLEPFVGSIGRVDVALVSNLPSCGYLRPHPPPLLGSARDIFRDETVAFDQLLKTDFVSI